ncbi:MAG: hypothetical protein IPP77_00715 [Bacteroidetes bacterium]|nr:hypothetical protein [Bacteroidota bacterium]
MESENNDQSNSSEISIWIDKYDDVFSDFDSRTYSERVLSTDFLTEVRKMVVNQPKSDVKFTFRLMDNQRDLSTEAIIMENIRIHFNRIAVGIQEEMIALRNKGYFMTSGGFALSIALVFLSTSVEHIRYINHIPMVLEPIAWFTTWTGLDHIFQLSRKDKPTYEFNKKMVSAEITFHSLEAPEAASTGTHGPTQKKVIPFGNNLRIAN